MSRFLSNFTRTKQQCMIRSEYLSDLRHTAREIRNDVQKEFYFLESEDLRRRPAPDKWSIIEVFAHINIFQAFYIKEISKALEAAPDMDADETHISWLGKQFIKSMKPSEEGVIAMKMPTFAKADPIKRAKKGIVINEKVVFSDFISDIEEMEDLIIKSYDKDITAVKVPTFLPFVKITIADALGFNMAHVERHILQAKNILE